MFKEEVRKIFNWELILSGKEGGGGGVGGARRNKTPTPKHSSPARLHKNRVKEKV